MRTFKGHTKEVNCIVVSSDGKTLVSGSGNEYSAVDTNVRIWDLTAPAAEGGENEAVRVIEEDAAVKCALKDLKKKREKELRCLEEEYDRLCKALETSKDNIKAFQEKLEAAGKLKQERITLLKEQRDNMAAEMREKATEIKALLSSTPLKCLKGHELEAEDTTEEWYCDCCLKNDSFGEMMTCMTCNWGLCKECTGESTALKDGEKTV